MDLTQKYKKLKEEKESLSTRLISEESSFKVLKEQYDTALAKLKSDYNVSSIDEAEALLQKVEQELNTLISNAESTLRLLDSSSDLSSDDLGL